jgi:hypothetical protein
MLRRGLALTTVAGVLASAAGDAQAAGAWIASNTLTPVEQRVAIAVGPSRTTLWTSLRFKGTGGKMAIVVPAPDGSAIDFSSDAWFEALEVATAPRIFPPPNDEPFCPGKSGSPNVFQLDGLVGHAASLAAQEITVLDGADKVMEWAGQEGLSISPALAASLQATGGAHFVAVRFDAPQGAGVTPTLRLAMPSSAAQLSLALTRAAGDDLRVTTWVIGLGRADLIGAAEVQIAPSSIAWNAKKSASDYDAKRDDALADDPTRFLVEAASHESLSTTIDIASGTATIDSVVSTFFERAAAYGDGNFDAASCLSAAEPALELTTPVATSCPQASVGVIDPATSCTEAPGPGQIDPAVLRCGPGADDLAVALSNLKPKDVWLTRQSLLIPSAGAGNDWMIGFVAGPTESSVIHAGSVDYGECADAGVPDGGSSASSSSGSSSGSSGSSGVIVHDHGSDPGGGVDVDVDWQDAADTVVDTACSCNGTETYSPDYADTTEDCSADGSDFDTGGCNGDSGGDSCSGDGSSSDGCSGDGTDTEGCSGSSDGGDSCSGGGDLGEACSAGGGSSDGCDGDFGKCSTVRSRRARGPRFSIVLLAALALLAPLRRMGRRSRGRRRQRTR